jgi:hypothetical protein
VGRVGRERGRMAPTVSRRSFLGAAIVGLVSIGPIGRLAEAVAARVKPAFRAASPPPALAGRPYHYRFVASEHPRYSVASGHLPAPLKLDRATGVVSGTPRSVGAQTFRIRATNSVGAATTRRLEIRTYPRNTKKPHNTHRPVISDRSPAVGQTIRVSHGTWT